VVEPIGFGLDAGLQSSPGDGVELAMEHGHAVVAGEDRQPPRLVPAAVSSGDVVGRLLASGPVAGVTSGEIGRPVGDPVDQPGLTDLFNRGLVDRTRQGVDVF